MLAESNGSDGVVLSSVEDFAGLESDVVILVLNEVATERARALAYSGMSRARVLLMVLGPPEAKPAINWA